MDEPSLRDRLDAGLRAAAVLAVYLAVPAFMLLFGMMAVGASEPQEIPSSLKLILSAFGYVLALGLITKRFARKGQAFAECTGFYPFAQGMPVYGWALASGIVLGLAAALILLWLPPALLREYDDASLQMLQGEARYLAFIITVIFSPVSEEIIFRGFLLRILRSCFSLPFSIAATALIFGLLHVNPVWIGYATVMGLLFGWISLTFNNLMVTIVLHMGFNLTSIIALFPETATWPLKMTSFRLTALVVLLCLAFLFFKKMLYAQRP